MVPSSRTIVTHLVTRPAPLRIMLVFSTGKLDTEAELQEEEDA